VFLGIASVAHELVQLLLGVNWSSAAMPLQLLSLIMPLRMISNFLPSALDGIGRPDISLRNLAIALLIMPTAFLVGINWGLLGLCLAWLLAFPVVFISNISRSLPALNLRTQELLRAIAPSALCAGAMYAMVSLTRAIRPSTSPFADLAILVAVGVVSYASIAAIFNRQDIRHLAQVLKA
jgi:O-antigen/teichoic acid export membrane protein